MEEGGGARASERRGRGGGARECVCVREREDGGGSERERGRLLRRPPKVWGEGGGAGRCSSVCMLATV